MNEIRSNVIEPEAKRRMFIASKSKIKADAVTAALGDIEILPVESQSNIPEQPMGYEQILQGVMNRIETGRKNGATEQITAIENGLLLGKELLSHEMVLDAIGEKVEEDSWYDVAFVAIDDGENHHVVRLSKGVKIPQYLIDKVLAVGDQSITMGKFLAKEHPEINHQDPHIFLTSGKISRLQLMADTIKIADDSLKLLKK